MKATQLGVVAAAVAPGSTNTHQINHMTELLQIISEGVVQMLLYVHSYFGQMKWLDTEYSGTDREA